MKKTATMLMMLVLACLLTAAQAQEKWQNLCNGKNLKNFKLLNGKAEFLYKEGVITGVSRINVPNSFLATKQVYDDFILEFETMVDDGLNSGVQIRSLSIPEYQDGRVHGYQIEIESSPRAWSGGIYDEARRGWLYNLECNPAGKTAFKPGEWNLYRVEAIGSRIRVWVNGQLTADIVDEMTPSGFIALQVHSIGQDTADEGKKVQWRNLRIMTEELERWQSPEEPSVPQISHLDNRLTPREIAEGWRLLWDGKTTQGWRGAKLAAFPEQGWQIRNGVLTVLKSAGGESRAGGDIITVDKYRNFELEVDFKLTPGANSGIKYFVDPEMNKGEGSAIGCEFQLLDDELHPDAKLGTAGNGTLASLYDLIAPDALRHTPTENTAKRQNKYGWNRARIVVNGSKVAHFLNGIKQVEYERGTQMWQALVSRSKYAVWPKFGELEEGHILLQEHGDEVEFRNIKIRVLP